MLVGERCYVADGLVEKYICTAGSTAVFFCDEFATVFYGVAFRIDFVTERGGQAVPSTDPTYQNNSRYYAGLAEDSEDNALESERRAKASEQAAKASEEILQYYVDFIIPRFVIQNNRLYISITSEGEFIVANNRLYIKNAS